MFFIRIKSAFKLFSIFQQKCNMDKSRNAQVSFDGIFVIDIQAREK